MNKITYAFKKNKAFIGFLTGGDPNIEKTQEFIMEMVRGGADIIEIGVPFSDPIAEGPVIQNANIRALSAGTTVDGLFELVENVRKQTDVPLIFLTYLNPVFHYGYEAFFKKSSMVGLNGIIIPDLPYEERQEAKSAADKYNIDIISMIAPTSKERIKAIAAQATGFLYIVSSMGVTGVRTNFSGSLKETMDAVRQETDLPAAIGFGIHTPAQAAEMAAIADGVIVGSAIVRIIEKHGADSGKYIYEYVKEMKSAVEC